MSISPTELDGARVRRCVQRQRPWSRSVLLGRRRAPDHSHPDWPANDTQRNEGGSSHGWACQRRLRVMLAPDRLSPSRLRPKTSALPAPWPRDIAGPAPCLGRGCRRRQAQRACSGPRVHHLHPRSVRKRPCSRTPGPRPPPWRHPCRRGHCPWHSYRWCVPPRHQANDWRRAHCQGIAEGYCVPHGHGGFLRSRRCVSLGPGSAR